LRRTPCRLGNHGRRAACGRGGEARLELGAAPVEGRDELALLGRQAAQRRAGLERGARGVQRARLLDKRRLVLARQRQVHLCGAAYWKGV